MSEKILIVDDDVDSLKLIGLMLQRHGYNVIAANSGTQALSKAATETPNLIILDIMMPDMDGYEVCRRLRANQGTQGIPIIMFTAKTLVDDKVAGFEAGADDYLTKPTHPAELASRVKAILARSVGQRRAEASKTMAIGVVGAKGGVGTTTLALNMAASLLLAGENPILADFCLGTGTMGLLLGADNISGMANVLGKPAQDIQPPLIEGELLLHASNLRALTTSPQPREAFIKFQPEAIRAIVNGLRVLGRPAIFDLGRGYNELNSRLMREMDQIILVIDPSRITITLARELLREMEKSGVGASHIHLVVVNRSQANMQIPWNELEQLLGRELRAIISEATELAFNAARNATPMVMLQPSSMVANQIAKLSEDLNARERTLASGQPTL
jgi:CheY-like chemotaxis protein/MinD-like ATPase involved in chromosome partitioning or flagellar assembly